jgi:hypothetical protein
MGKAGIPKPGLVCNGTFLAGVRKGKLSAVSHQRSAVRRRLSGGVAMMRANEKQIWFPAKRYGWGWGLPCAWQGWVVMAVWLGLLFGAAFLTLPGHKRLWIASVVVLVVVLTTICFLKGEKPRWRWGDNGKQ